MAGNRRAPWWQAWFGPRYRKESTAARLLYRINMGRPTWTPRNYDQLADEAYVKNAVAYRCVRLIAESAANVPWLVYVGDREQSEHPLLKLLQKPNRFQGGFELMDAFYSYLQLAGNSYLENVMLRGAPTELYALRPDRMQVMLGARGWPDGYKYTVGNQATEWRVPDVGKQGEIMHMRLFHPTNDHYGMSPVEAAAYSIDQHAATSQFNKALLENSGRPSGALVTPDELGDDAYGRLSKDLEERYTGHRGAGKPLLLEGGLTWTPFSLSPDELQLIDGRRELAREIALSFGVPPMILGIPGDNTYSNYQEANRALYRQTVLPLVDRAADAITSFFEPTWADIQLRYNTDELEALAEERKARWDQANSASFLTVDEKRQMVGYSPLPDGAGDVVLVPSGQVPIDMVGFEPGGEEPDDGEEADADAEAEDDGDPAEDEADEDE